MSANQDGLVLRDPRRRPLLDIRAAGTYTGLGERYMRRLRADRSVPCVRIGGRLLFDPDDLDELIERHREPAITSETTRDEGPQGTRPADRSAMI